MIATQRPLALIHEAKPGFGMTSYSSFSCRYEGPAGGPVDRDWRHNEGCHPAGGETGSYSCRSDWVNGTGGRSDLQGLGVNVTLCHIGVAAVAIESSEGGKWIKDNYKSSHCITEELQVQLDQRNFDFFKGLNK